MNRATEQLLDVDGWIDGLHLEQTIQRVKQVQPENQGKHKQTDSQAVSTMSKNNRELKVVVCT
jgi:hypothetical protein